MTITPIIIIIIISILSFVLFDMKRAAVGGKDKVQHGGVHKGQQLSCLIKITPSCVRSQLQEVADCKKKIPPKRCCAVWDVTSPINQGC